MRKFNFNGHCEEHNLSSKWLVHSQCHLLTRLKIHLHIGVRRPHHCCILGRFIFAIWKRTRNIFHLNPLRTNLICTAIRQHHIILDTHASSIFPCLSASFQFSLFTLIAFIRLPFLPPSRVTLLIPTPSLTPHPSVFTHWLFIWKHPDFCFNFFLLFRDYFLRVVRCARSAFWSHTLSAPTLRKWRHGSSLTPAAGFCSIIFKLISRVWLNGGIFERVFSRVACRRNRGGGWKGWNRDHVLLTHSIFSSGAWKRCKQKYGMVSRREK